MKQPSTFNLSQPRHQSKKNAYSSNSSHLAHTLRVTCDLRHPIDHPKSSTPPGKKKKTSWPFQSRRFWRKKTFPPERIRGSPRGWWWPPSNYSDSGPQKVASKEGEMGPRLFQGNLGWWNIWPDESPRLMVSSQTWRIINNLGYLAKNHGLIRSLLSPKDRATWDPFQNGLYKWFVNRCYYLLTNWDDPPRRVVVVFVGPCASRVVYWTLSFWALVEREENISMGYLKRLCTPQTGAGFFH